MKKILAIILFLLFALSNATAQTDPISVVRKYESLMQQWIRTDDGAYREKIEQMLKKSGRECRFNDNIAQRINVQMNQSGDVMLATYLNYIEFLIPHRLTFQIVAPEVKKSDGFTYVYAWVHYSWQTPEKETIHINEVCGFRITNGAISSVTYNGQEEMLRRSMPFKINSVTIANVDNNGRAIAFDTAHIQYLKTTIKYFCTIPGSYGVDVKIFGPDDTMLTDAKSSSGYSIRNPDCTFSLEDGTITLKTFGGRNTGKWKAGIYRCECYCNGSLIDKHPFYIPNDAQACNYQDENGVVFSTCSDVSKEYTEIFCTANFNKCKSYVTDFVKRNPQKYNIPNEMIIDHPCLVYLVIGSKSLTLTNEVQTWLDIYFKMNDDAISQLYLILLKERKELIAIQKKYDLKGN